MGGNVPWLQSFMKYTNYETGKEQTEEASFHLNKTDMLRLNCRSGRKHGRSCCRTIVDREDAIVVFDFIEEVIGPVLWCSEAEMVVRLSATDSVRHSWNSEPYAELLASFVVDQNIASEFFRGVMIQVCRYPEAVLSGKSYNQKEK